VFVNACASARTIVNDEGDPSSLVEGFLTHCASGYIGTLADIDIQTASEIARSILKASLNANGVRITEILRHLRAKAVEDLMKALLLPPEQSKKEFYKVIDTFMYVYYGNPLAYLQLRAVSSEEASA
jgi:hypothetical protein